jgi:hypothetical protein
MPGSRREGREPRTALVAPLWDLSAGSLLRAYMAAGRKAVWLGPQGFRFEGGGILTHDDWAHGDWNRLDGIVVASLCGRQDAELFEWRRSVLEEIRLGGLPVVPDPRCIQLAWEPTRALLRLRRAGVPVIDHYVGENLDDAIDFVRRWKGAQFRVPEGGASEIEWISPGEAVRERLEELWQEYPTGPFVLTRDVRGEVATLLVLGGELAVAWRDGTPGLEPEHVADAVRDGEDALALSAAEAFGLDPVAVEVVRDSGGAQVHAVRPLGFWKAALETSPALAAELPQRLGAILAKSREPS